MNNEQTSAVDNIYVVHAPTGYEVREKILRKVFDENRFGYQFVTESLDAHENEELIKKYFAPNIKSVLHKGALYCTLVHFLIYERFLASNHKYAIIFENDVCFLGDFKNDIKKIIAEANTLQEGFIISLENSTLRFPPWRETKKGKYLYEADKGRCAGAYLIDKTAAQRMLDHLKYNKCNVVIDHWQNTLLDQKLLKMYWAHPPLIEQGSFNGKLPSSISVRAGGNFRSIKWAVQKFYKMYLLRLFR
jgi:glycosyl transferase, family 25